MSFLYLHNLYAVCELTCSNDFRDKQGVLKLMMGARGPLYHLPGNVIYATVGLVYINLQPEYELPSSTRFGQFRKFGKNWSWGHRPPSHPYGNSFYPGSEFLFVATCASDLTFLTPLTSEIYAASQIEGQ